MATIKTIQENEDELWKTYTSKMNEKIAESDAIYDNQKNTVSTLYDGKISDVKQQYEEDLRANEVQKYINAREVAENNANLGLTDSGLNRTQQTAVQLSASNNAAKIERQRQSAVDELTRLMTSDLAEIEGNKSAAQLSIKDKYENLVNSAAVAKYEADWEAYEKQVEAEQKKTSAKNSAYATLVKDLDANNNSENPYDKNTKAALIKAYIDEHGYSDVSELNALLSAGRLNSTEYSEYLTNGKIAIQIPDSKYPNDIFVKKALNRNNGLYYTPMNLLK